MVAVGEVEIPPEPAREERAEEEGPQRDLVEAVPHQRVVVGREALVEAEDRFQVGVGGDGGREPAGLPKDLRQGAGFGGEAVLPPSGPVGVGVGEVRRAGLVQVAAA